jgi:predicted 2-oxoglutarate/Fe(II)-dependent dioxygenase YbiX
MEKIPVTQSEMIGIYRNFLTGQEIDYFMSIANQFSQQEISFENKPDPGYTFWDKKNIALNEIQDLDKSLLDNVQQRVESIFTLDYLGNNDPGHSFVPMNMIHRFQPGDDMAEHSDRGPEANGNHNIAYGFVVYLNDNYDGGEIYYSNLDLEVKPVAGDLVIHPSDVLHTHGVREVISGNRYTLTMFARDPKIN